jgi:hypothetical protein
LQAGRQAKAGTKEETDEARLGSKGQDERKKGTNFAI